MDDLKSCLLVLISVLVLSPVLKTLTDSISTDTIYAMTVSKVPSKVFLLQHDFVFIMLGGSNCCEILSFDRNSPGCYRI